MNRFVVFGGFGTIGVLATAIMLTNIANNNIIPKMLDIAVQESTNELINTILASTAIVALFIGINFGLKIKSTLKETDKINIKSIGIGFLLTLPVVNFAFLTIIASSEKQNNGETFKDYMIQYIIPYTLGVAAIVGSAFAIGFADEIHQYFVTNVAELPIEMSRGLANILTPDHILGMGVGIIIAISIPLLHTLVTMKTLDISFAEPRDALLCSGLLER